MEIVTLKIKNKSKFRHFLDFIKDLDYVEVLKKETPSKKNNAASDDDFFALAGMWKNRDINADELRSNAWPKSR